MGDGERVASIGDDGKLLIWDPRANHVVAVAEQPCANCLATHPASARIAVGSGDDINVWQLVKGQLRRSGQPLSEHTGLVVAVAFTEDGKRLVSSSEDRSVKLWSLEPSSGESGPSPVPEPIRRMFEQGRPPSNVDPSAPTRG